MAILQQPEYLFVCNASLPVNKFLVTSHPNPATCVHRALFHHLPLLGRVWAVVFAIHQVAVGYYLLTPLSPLHQTT